MTVRLRPHHLLCLLTYAGKGYSPTFVANYDAIADRLRGGEALEVVAGPDDICAPLLDDPEAHCRRDSVAERDRLAAGDVGALLGLTVRTGLRLELDAKRLEAMRKAFSAGLTRAACAGCEWHELCTAIASGEYCGTRL